MADTEQITILRLGANDAKAALVLSTEARWNQNEADWLFFLTRGIVFGVRDGNRLIATAALLPYSAGNAWISMVLVTADWRRRGIATRLVDACLHAAREKDLTTWLDATPDGATVYGPLGFTPTLQLRRLRLEHAPAMSITVPPSACRLDALIARDTAAMGFERAALLGAFSDRSGSRVLSNGEAIALVRDGRTARQIGPLFSSDTAAALALVNAIVRCEAGPWLIDVVYGRDALLNGLVDSGWNIERPFQRMRLGQTTTIPVELPFAVAGPEFG